MEGIGDQKPPSESVGLTTNPPESNTLARNPSAEEEEDELSLVEEMVEELLKQSKDENSLPPLELIEDFSLPTLPFAAMIEGINESSELMISDSESSSVAATYNSTVEIGTTTSPARCREGMMDDLPAMVDCAMDEEDPYWHLVEFLGYPNLNYPYDGWLPDVLSEPTFENDGRFQF